MSTIDTAKKKKTEGMRKALTNLASLKFRVYTKYQAIMEDINSELTNLPPEVAKSFDDTIQYLDVDIECDEQFQSTFYSLIYSKYYDMYVKYPELPKDSSYKVSSLIKRSYDRYAEYLAGFLGDKICSLQHSDDQILYCIDAVYRHLNYANIDQPMLKQILKVDASYTSFAFTIAGRILELAIANNKDK